MLLRWVNSSMKTDKSILKSTNRKEQTCSECLIVKYVVLCVFLGGPLCVYLICAVWFGGSFDEVYSVVNCFARCEVLHRVLSTIWKIFVLLFGSNVLCVSFNAVFCAVSLFLTCSKVLLRVYVLHYNAVFFSCCFFEFVLRTKWRLLVWVVLQLYGVCEHFSLWKYANAVINALINSLSGLLNPYKAVVTRQWNLWNFNLTFMSFNLGYDLE